MRPELSMIRLVGALLLLENGWAYAQEIQGNPLVDGLIETARIDRAAEALPADLREALSEYSQLKVKSQRLRLEADEAAAAKLIAPMLKLKGKADLAREFLKNSVQDQGDLFALVKSDPELPVNQIAAKCTEAAFKLKQEKLAEI